MEISSESLEIMTNNAEEWAEYFQSQASDTYERQAAAVVLSQCFDSIQEVLLKELNDAIDDSKEFSRDLLRFPLQKAFSNPGIIAVTQGGDIYFKAEEFAGDTGDFWDGIEGAREELGVDPNKRSPAQRAAYWRTKVWPAEEGVWSDTILLRREFGWGDLAPYWFVLEHGNIGNPYAFPIQEPTNFLYKAQIKAQGIFDNEYYNQEVEATNLIVEAAENFMSYPDSYEPYDVLDRFYAKGNSYLVYVTSTRKVGVALPETFTQLKREYT